MDFDFIKVAEEMLGETIPSVLQKRLCRVHFLAESEGGGLYSRQIVAMMVEQWEREQ